MLVTDAPDNSARVKGELSEAMLPGVEPEMVLTLQALLKLGSARPDTWSAGSSAHIEQLVHDDVATEQSLQAISSGMSPFDGYDGMPRASLLLAETQLYEALIDRYIEQFEYVGLQHNQYLLFGARERAELRLIYESFLHNLMVELSSDRPAGELRSVVVEHHQQLWQFAQSLLERQLGDGGLWTPPCHEYDPQFQLALWHVKPNELQEPILDLGCGANARLVHYLRKAGLEAWGMDRFSGHSEYVLHGDWLETPLASNYWGTIISHMGFSNHFFHHHLRKDGHPERYARRFMEIINALKPGGRFLYAPGLPFFEPLLPEERVRVVTHPITVDDVGIDTIELMSGPDSSAHRDALDVRQPALYATEIRRM